MKSGDRVVVPGFHDQGSFSVFEIVEGSPLHIGSIEVAELRTWVGKTVSLKDGLLYRESEENPVDLGFAIKVRPVVMDLSRSLFADAKLTSRMKTLWLNSDISDLQESIDRAIDGYRSDHPINLHTTLLERHTQVTLDAICSELNPAKFEQLIAWYFLKVGATQVEIPPKNERDKEGDADIVATFVPIKTIIYVQAKKHTGETNGWAVEQIKNYRDKQDTVLNETDAMDDGYSRIAWVVSTADGFSKECSSLAKQNRVLLLNGREFVRLLLNAGLEGLEKAF